MGIGQALCSVGSDGATTRRARGSRFGLSGVFADSPSATFMFVTFFQLSS